MLECMVVMVLVLGTCYGVMSDGGDDSILSEYGADDGNSDLC